MGDGVVIRDKKRRRSEYMRWSQMKDRCANPAHGSYAYFTDVGLPLSADLSLDRIDNNGNYSCGQCDECTANGWPMNIRWATRQQQSNQRRAIWITHNGETLHIAEWVRRAPIAINSFDALAEALKDAKETIKTWHGPDAWDIYDEHSPEMIRLNSALDAALNPKG